MAMRLSGLMSGMDTESIVEQLVQAKRTKVDKAVKAQKKLSWKQDAWKALNTKIMNLYNGALSNLRFESSFMKKVTKVSNSSIVSVITGDGAMNSVQSLKVKELAQSGYLTGGQLGDGKKGYTSDTSLSELGIETSGKISVTVGDEQKEITIDGSMTIGSLVNAFKNAGLTASFDATNQRFYIASKDTGTANDFSITASNADGLEALKKLGLAYSDSTTTKKYDDMIAAAQGSQASRESSRLRELTSNIDSLQKLQDSRLMELTTKYGDALKEKLGKDIADASIDEIKTAVSELYGDDSEAYADLENWADDWDQTAADLEAEIQKATSEGRIQQVGDGWELTDNEKSAITQEINDEVDVLTNLKSAAASASGAIKNAATDAEIELNGATYTSSKNTFEINGLTLTVNAKTADGETVTLTTQDDTDGIYDMIKNFIKEYNALINEMDKLYNADSAKDYEPLTDDEKESMSDSEIEEWETKIKDSLLRRDDSLNSVASAMKEIMMQGTTVNGKKMYLSDFGIETLDYFLAADNEKNAYHIAGDADDSNTAGNADKLRSMIANDPQTVIDFFVGLSRTMYSKLTELGSKTDYSSSYTFYEDIKMKNDYDDYTSKIKELEAKLADYEDKWYSKFAAMETAMAKMQSNASAVTALLGG